MRIHSKGCHHLWCEPKCDNQSMELLPDVWLSYPMPCRWSTTSNQVKTRPISCGAGRRHPFVKATTLRNELRTAVGVNISTQTVHNSLRQSGLRSRRACIRIPLPRLHKQARLNSTQDHLNWTDNDWDPEFFNDESRYCLDFTDRRTRVGEDMWSNFKMPICLNMNSIMVWGGISRGGRTDPHIVIKGITTSLCYRDDILDVYVRPYAGAIGPQFVLTDDNARLHHDRVVEEYLQQDTIVPMDWLAFSPDLNPIEHAWNMLQVAILRCPDQTTKMS